LKKHSLKKPKWKEKKRKKKPPVLRRVTARRAKYKPGQSQSKELPMQKIKTDEIRR